MTRTRFALAAWAIVSATVSSQASANVINVVQADFGVISPLPYSRSFGDTFTGIASTGLGGSVSGPDVLFAIAYLMGVTFFFLM